jgi:hypothetical protein
VTDYVLTGQHAEIVAAAKKLLDRVMMSGHVRPAALVSVAKLLHVLACLPRSTPGMSVAVGVSSLPRTSPDGVETRHYWEVTVDAELLAFTSGGYYGHPETGGDSFTSLSWEARPGQEPVLRNHFERLSIVPGIQPIALAIEQLDLRDGRFSLDVTDPQNQLLDDLGDHATREAT